MPTPNCAGCGASPGQGKGVRLRDISVKLYNCYRPDRVIGEAVVMENVPLCGNCQWNLTADSWTCDAADGQEEDADEP